MALTLPLIPTRASYSGNQDTSTEVLSVRLDGGASRFRRDIVNGTRLVNVQWSLNPAQYNDLCTFYRAAKMTAGEAFNVKLILDDAEPTFYQAHFVPGSFSLQEQRGHTYIVTAQLEAVPPLYDDAYEMSYWMMVSTYGSPEAALEIINLLHYLVNIKLPPAVGTVA